MSGYSVGVLHFYTLLLQTSNPSQNGTSAVLEITLYVLSYHDVLNRKE